MSVQQELPDLGDLFNFSNLSTFTQNIPVEWVASARGLSSQATIRRRRLPADQVLWLVLGMALFRMRSINPTCPTVISGEQFQGSRAS